MVFKSQNVMKKLVLLFIVFLLGQVVAYSQSNDDKPIPNTIKHINYQGIVRDDNGVALSNQPVTIQFDFIDYSAGGTSLYKEEHSVQTNDYGLVSLPIGGGTQLSGSLNIEVRALWEQADRIEVSADFNDGSGLHVIDNVYLKAVPYAFRSKYEGQTLDSVTVGGTHFIVISDANGQPLDSVALPSSSGGVTFPNGGSDGQVLTIVNGGYAWGSNDDADADATNELQTLSGSITQVDSMLHLSIVDVNGNQQNQLDLNLRPFLSDDQEITNFNLNGNNELSITIEDGNTQIVDLSVLRKDYDWFKVNTQNGNPSSITDDIWTRGKVGIGTSLPVAKLDIKTNNSAVDPLYVGHDANTPLLVVKSDSTVGIGTPNTNSTLTVKAGAPSQDVLFVGRGGNAYLKVNNVGKVGIGLGSPGAKLHVLDYSANNAVNIKQNHSGGHGLQIDVKSTSGSQNLFLAESIDGSGNVNQGSVFIIKSDGRVGIGTNNPNTNSKLDVNGTIRIESTISSNSNTNELNRSTTGDADLLPLAYGRIKNYPITSYPNPVIDGATSNVASVVYSSSTSGYSISLNQIDFNTTYGYVVLISVEKTSSTPIIPVYSSIGNNLKVTLYDLAGNKVRGNFSFIIYKK